MTHYTIKDTFRDGNGVAYAYVVTDGINPDRFMHADILMSAIAAKTVKVSNMDEILNNGTMLSSNTIAHICRLLTGGNIRFKVSNNPGLMEIKARENDLVTVKFDEGALAIKTEKETWTIVHKSKLAMPSNSESKLSNIEFKSLNLTGMNLLNIESAKKMFRGCTAEELILGEFSDRLTNTSGMFSFCKIGKLDISRLNLLSIREMQDMFANSEIDELKIPIEMLNITEHQNGRPLRSHISDICEVVIETSRKVMPVHNACIDNIMYKSKIHRIYAY